jgi:hypothetical protein
VTDKGRWKGNPWDRQRDENDKPEPLLWYKRFAEYLSMDPADRSVLAIYKKDRERRGVTKKPLGPPASWSYRSKQWEWRERAEAHDLVRIKAERALAEDGWKRAATILGQAAPDAAHALKDVMGGKHLGQKRLAADSILDRAEETATKQVHGISDDMQRLLMRIGTLALKHVRPEDRDSFEEDFEKLLEGKE